MTVLCFYESDPFPTFVADNLEYCVMKEEDYAFITVDNDAEMTDWSDAVVIDMDGQYDLTGAIVIDENFGDADFITLSDETVMLSDIDMVDFSSTDMDIDSTTISFGL